MSAFILSGFADEISIDFDQQIEGLKRLGLDFMEIRMVDGRSIVEYTLDEVKGFKAKLDHAGIRISAVGSPIGKVLITDDFDGYFTLFKHTLDIAGILETPFIRMFSFYIPTGGSRKEHRDEVLFRLTAFVREAEKRHITLLHENEAGIYGQDAVDCLDLLLSISSPYFMAVFDPANFVCADNEVYPHAYHLLKDYIRYLHIKDAVKTSDGHRITPAGEGNGNVQKVLESLYKSGFSGFLSIEPHLHDVYSTKDVFAAYREALARGETGVVYTGDGYDSFKRAHDALAKLLREVER